MKKKQSILALFSPIQLLLPKINLIKLVANPKSRRCTKFAPLLKGHRVTMDSRSRAVHVVVSYSMRDRLIKITPTTSAQYGSLEGFCVPNIITVSIRSPLCITNSFRGLVFFVCGK